jgi:DNA repair protein RadC
LVNALDHAAKPVAAALIESFGSMAAVLSAGTWQLARVPGMTEAAARLLEAAFAAARWAAEEQIRERDLFADPAAVHAYARATMRGRRAEEAHGLFLDAGNQLIRDQLLSRGIVDQAPLYPREVARQAVLLEASAVVLLHNHPSGDPTPSAADVESTQRVGRALAAVGVTLHDHLIVGDNRIASMRSMGLFR